MAIKYIPIRGHAGRTCLGEVVSQQGMRVTVKACTARFAGVDYILASDQVYECESPTNLLHVAGYLVRCRGDGSALVFVEEVSSVIPVPYAFSSSPYERIERLFWATVPAGAKTLEGVEVNAITIVAPEDRNGSRS